MASEASKEVPTAPAVEPSKTTSSAEAAGEGAQSKKGAKKAEAKAKKEAEKARKAAEREAAAAASSTGGASSEDFANENYGNIAPHTTTPKLHGDAVQLRELGEKSAGKVVRLRAWIQNARMQGAKMAFVELREESNWTIQGVVAASNEPKEDGVSRQMVKWVGGLRLESFVEVQAVVKKPLEPVKSCKVSGYEMHLQKCYLVAPAPEMLGLSLAPASRAVGRLDEEEQSEAEKAIEGYFCCISGFETC